MFSQSSYAAPLPCPHLPHRPLCLTRTLGSRLLALGRGLHRPHPALQSAQREVLEVWRCCLSYGIDVASTDIVMLAASEQDWWPGVSSPAAPSSPPLVAAGGHRTTSASPAAAISSISTDNRAVPDSAAGRILDGSAGASGGTAAEGATEGGAGADADAGGAVMAIPPGLPFLRALHQLTCACVIPPGHGGNTHGRVGEKPGGDVVLGGSGGEAGGSRGGTGQGNGEDSIGGVEIAPEMWAHIGDTVDAAVEAVVLWLFGGGGGKAGDICEEARETVDRAIQVRSRSGVLNIIGIG